MSLIIPITNPLACFSVVPQGMNTIPYPVYDAGGGFAGYYRRVALGEEADAPERLIEFAQQMTQIIKGRGEVVEADHYKGDYKGYKYDAYLFGGDSDAGEVEYWGPRGHYVRTNYVSGMGDLSGLTLMTGIDDPLSKTEWIHLQTIHGRKISTQWTKVVLPLSRLIGFFQEQGLSLVEAALRLSSIIYKADPALVGEGLKVQATDGNWYDLVKREDGAFALPANLPAGVQVDENQFAIQTERELERYLERRSMIDMRFMVDQIEIHFNVDENTNPTSPIHSTAMEIYNYLQRLYAQDSPN